jgi:UPF0271 protein
MADTGGVPAIDLNADLAEGDELTPSDLALLDVVTSASLACGFHAGNRRVMRSAATACTARGVVIGAHVAYRDRAGFGRRALDTPPDELAADVVEQWEALAEEAGAVGGTIAYVKAHGALYHRLASDPAVAAALVDALASRCPVLVVPPDSAAAAPARASGVRVVAEGFCDRGYDATGALLPRYRDGALVEDPLAAGDQARSLAVGRGVTAVGGGWVDLEVETLCIHGDRPGAEVVAVAVRRALEAGGVTVRPFAPARS